MRALILVFALGLALAASAQAAQRAPTSIPAANVVTRRRRVERHPGRGQRLEAAPQTMRANPEVVRYLGTGRPSTPADVWRMMAGFLGQWALNEVEPSGRTPHSSPLGQR